MKSVGRLALAVIGVTVLLSAQSMYYSNLVERVMEQCQAKLDDLHELQVQPGKPMLVVVEPAYSNTDSHGSHTAKDSDTLFTSPVDAMEGPHVNVIRVVPTDDDDDDDESGDGGEGEIGNAGLIAAQKEADAAAAAEAEASADPLADPRVIEQAPGSTGSGGSEGGGGKRPPPVSNTPSLSESDAKAGENIEFVQLNFYKRPPIKNIGLFEFFYIKEDLYEYKGRLFNRTCTTGVVCDYTDIFSIITYVSDKDYIYFIEDDTYFCGDGHYLSELIEANPDFINKDTLVLTGVGASGWLIGRDLMDKMWKSVNARNLRNEQTGYDIVAAYDFKANTYRLRINLNAHLYEGSVLGHNHGNTDTNYPTCFELSCAVGPINCFDHFNLHCAEDIHRSGDKSCLVGASMMLRPGFWGKYCTLFEPAKAAKRCIEADRPHA